MLVVDASVWLSRFLVDEDAHEISREWLERYLRARGRLVEPMLLLAELAGALARRTGAQDTALETAERLGRLRSIRFVSVDRRLGALATRLAAEGRLRGADAIYVALAYRLGVPLLTWDREQRDRSAGHVQVGTPAEMDPDALV